MLDLADAFHHHGVVVPVRAAMQRQASHERALLMGGQQHAVDAEIVKAESTLIEAVHHVAQGPEGHDLVRQQVMALHLRIIAGAIQAIDRPERDPGTLKR